MNFKHKQLIILDRDGVINEDSDDYIKSVDEWIALPGSLEAIKRLNDAGKIVGVATNQSGLAYGLFTMNDLTAMHELFYQKLNAIGGRVDALKFCPHHPTEVCICRKPNPGMIQDLLAQFSIAPENAMMIGDTLRDLQAANAAGVEAVLVRTGKGERTLLAQKDFSYPVYDDLASVVEHILHDA